MQCADIDDSLMVDLAGELYPKASPATINRQLYTPIIAVLRQASKSKACAKPDFTRPEGHTAETETKVPDLQWFRSVLPELTPPLRACLLFMTLHGRRTKDALTRKPEHYDPERGQLLIGRTKNGEALMIELSEPVIRAIEAYDWRWEGEKASIEAPGAGGLNRAAGGVPRKADSEVYLFGLSYASRKNLVRALEVACERAGVPFFNPHAIGRHSFATRLLRLGYSVKHVASAGGWKDPKMVMRRYGHLAKSEVSQSVKDVGKDWGSGLLPKPGKDES